MRHWCPRMGSVWVTLKDGGSPERGSHCRAERLSLRIPLENTYPQPRLKTPPISHRCLIPRGLDVSSSARPLHSQLPRLPEQRPRLPPGRVWLPHSGNQAPWRQAWSHAPHFTPSSPGREMCIQQPQWLAISQGVSPERQFRWACLWGSTEVIRRIIFITFKWLDV